jgi:hypothetical protein
MAVWQFDLYLVPRSKLAQISDNELQRLSEVDFTATSWWEGITLPSHYREILATFLPRGASWTPEIEMWGEEEGDRIDISHRGAVLEEIRCRVDVRINNVGFLEGILRLAVLADCWIITEELEVIPSTLEALMKEIKNSSAYRFVLNPSAYLDEGDNLD